MSASRIERGTIPDAWWRDKVRRRHPPWRVEIVSASRLTARLVSVRLGGEDFDGLEDAWADCPNHRSRHPVSSDGVAGDF